MDGGRRRWGGGLGRFIGGSAVASLGRMQPRHNGRRAREAVHRLAAATADHRPTAVRRVHRARRGRLEQDPRRAPVAGALPLGIIR